MTRTVKEIQRDIMRAPKDQHMPFVEELRAAVADQHSRAMAASVDHFNAVVADLKERNIVLHMPEYVKDYLWEGIWREQYLKMYKAEGAADSDAFTLVTPLLRPDARPPLTNPDAA